MQFQAAVSHPMDADTKALCIIADNSRNDQDETALVTTSESLELPPTAAAVVMFALKAKYQKF